MATPARRTLTPDQRERVAMILHGEISLWVDRFGADLVREVLDEIEGRATTPDPEPPASAAVVPFRRPSSTPDAVASDD